jgi:uncharacterized SAM-binding protein YcdF (DUF218 family)
LLCDVLVVFGARVRPPGVPSPVLLRRLEGAVAAGEACRDPLYLVMGGEGGSGPPEADVMAQVLRERGVAPARILRERRSRDTLEQARRVAAILADMRGVGRVLVCTSPFHQPRCVLLLRMLGVRAERAAMPGDRAGLGLRRLVYFIGREAIASFWDGLLLACLIVLRRGPLTTPVRPAR